MTRRRVVQATRSRGDMPKRPSRSRGSRACLRLSVRPLGHRYAPHLPPGRTAPSRSATHLSCAAWSTAAQYRETARSNRGYSAWSRARSCCSSSSCRTCSTRRSCCSTCRSCYEPRKCRSRFRMEATVSHGTCAHMHMSHTTRVQRCCSRLGGLACASECLVRELLWMLSEKE